MPINSQVFLKYPNPVLIETGTFGGDGVQAALIANCFGSIHSIELRRPSAERATDKFKQNKNVTIHNGNSGELLGQLLEQIDTPVTFFLDAHGAYEKKNNCPIIEELEAIGKHPLCKHHTIMIDDVRLFLVGGWGVHLDQIRESLEKIRPGQKITYESSQFRDDILVSHPLEKETH